MKILAPSGPGQWARSIERTTRADWTEKAIEQRDPLIMHFVRHPKGRPWVHLSMASLAKMMNLPESVL